MTKKNKHLSHLNEKEIIAIIQKVCNKMVSKYKFGYYDVDDMRQEAFIIGWLVLPKFNGTAPLENFLSVHIRRRLLNFHRDHYYRSDIKDDMSKRSINNIAKKNLIDTISIDNVQDENEDNMFYYIEFINDIECAEVLKLIDIHLDINLRTDYLRMKDGITISKVKKDKIYEAINVILEEHNYGYIKTG